MRKARIVIAVVGILLPYVARIPGALIHGATWLTSYFGSEWWAIFFFGAFDALTWGSIIAATRSYQHVRSCWFPAVFGFALPLVAHTVVDLSADAQAAIALVIIPVYSLVGVVIGWLLGLWYDRRVTRLAARQNQGIRTGDGGLPGV
jgi:hypothetical protein